MVTITEVEGQSGPPSAKEGGRRRTAWLEATPLLLKKVEGVEHGCLEPRHQEGAASHQGVGEEAQQTPSARESGRTYIYIYTHIKTTYDFMKHRV